MFTWSCGADADACRNSVRLHEGLERLDIVQSAMHGHVWMHVHVRMHAVHEHV